MNDLYRFEYRGETQPKANIVSVKLGLAKIFGVAAEQIDPLLKGQACFIRDPIPEVTARLYYEKFIGIGAVGYIDVSTKHHSSKIEYKTARNNENIAVNEASDRSVKEAIEPSCPKCHSHNIDKDQCHNCGIYIKKYLAKNQRQDTSNEADYEHQLADHSSERRSGTKWIAVSVTVLYGLILLESYLNPILLAFAPDLDIGLFPYLVVHLGLIYGCVQYSSAKGYNPLLGLLGVLSLAGLSVLLLLKDHDKKYNSSSPKQWIFALFCIVYSGYWCSTKLAEKGHVSGALELAESLETGRFIFPSQQLNQDLNALNNEEQDLQDYIQSTLMLLKDGDYGNVKQKQISNALMKAIAEYQLWKDYQTYLYFTQSEEPPEFFSFKYRRGEGARLMDTLENSIDFNGERTATLVTLQSWMFGESSFLEQDNDPWPKFYSYVIELNRYLKLQASLFIQETAPSEGPFAFDLTSVKDYPINPAYKVSIDKNTVRFELQFGKYGKRYLTLGYYPKFKNGRKGRRLEEFDHVMIDTNIPLKQLRRPYNGLEFLPYPGDH